MLGARGIAPAAELLAFVRERWAFCSVRVAHSLWLTGAERLALQALCAPGTRRGSRSSPGGRASGRLRTAWLAYLSLSNVGDVFTHFQWDMLLLESGVVGMFAASPEPRLGVWLARALLFKLMFLSGAVKLLSGDPTWRDLTALEYHYWTQPLPLPRARSQPRSLRSSARRLR